MAKILVIEDDVEYAETLHRWLSHEHHSAEIVHNGQDARSRLQVFEYDLIILDWLLPGLSGKDLCEEFRSHGGLTPILMLTGKSAIVETEAGLDAGADDYLTKPCHMKELSARIRALLRRSSGLTSNILTSGGLVLDPGKWRVTKDGEELHLQRREFSLLEFLMRNPDTVFSADALLERVWAPDVDATPDAIRKCIMRLRRKIDVGTEFPTIQTVHGVGYKLQTS